MNIFNIIIAKVSSTITIVMISLGLWVAPTPVVEVVPVDPVTVVVATATSTEPEETPISTVFLNPVVVTATVATTTRALTATTTPVVQATTSPVVVPVITLPTTTYQVAPAVAPQTVIIQIQQQPEILVASAPIPMGTTYTLKKGEQDILTSVSEAEIRTFAEGLNSQINWRKQVRVIEMEKLAEALLLNGYTLSED